MPDVSALLISLATPLLALANDVDPSPEPEDVKAGYPALFLFLGLLVVIGLLGVSMARHLRRAQANRDAGMYGDPPIVPPVAPVGAQDTGRPGDEVEPDAGRESPGGSVST